MLRRRMMMETGRSAAKYPFVNGRHEFSEDGSYIEVSNGNHVKAYMSQTTQSFFNVSNINQNTSSVTNSANTDYLSTIWFTIPGGSTCVLKIINMSSIDSDIEASVNLRIAESATSLNFGITNFSDLNDKEGTIYVVNNQSISCFILWTNRYQLMLEFDVELYVNGERWI